MRVEREKKRLKVDRMVGCCGDCVKDLLALVMKHVDFKEMFGVEQVPKRISQDWAGLFIKEQSLTPHFEHVDNIVMFGSDMNLTQNYIKEIKRQNAMDIINFEDYCELRWPWDAENTKKMELKEINAGMNVLG